MPTLHGAVLAVALSVLPAPVPPPAAVAPGADVTPAAVDRVVEEYRAAVAVPGVAVAVTRGEEILHVAGYGHSPDGAPVTPHSTMATASLSKSFTALAVLQLVEDGRLGLDDPLRTHLPDAGSDDPRWARITLRQLLDQTSGLTDATLPQFSRPQPDDLAGSVASFRGRAPEHDPGSTWEYYNPNVQIAARIVEVVSGQPFATRLDTHVFGPLGMTDSRTIATADELPPSAWGHLRVLGRAVALPEPPAFGTGSGGVLSSAHDLAGWLLAQSGHRPAVVSPASITAMHTPSPASGGYGLGWDTGTTPGGQRSVSHGGDIFTSTAHQAVLPDAGIGVAVLANTGAAHGDAHEIARRIIALADRTPSPPPADPGAGIDAALAAVSAGAVALAAAGIRRAPTWAARRSSRWGFAFRVIPLLAPVGLLGAMAPVVRTLFRGRDVTWLQAAYLFPAFTVALAVIAAAATALFVRRVQCWSTRAGRAAP
ncbi:serine hydrolase domain-containing protein [Pseudonocardia nematodicida]|uniref:Serine hydrolase domain-containing protein n=1 Tax=Pseudonocardia nematodicida TaxID=1206997 RepID=A0ABV1KI77_9PSEU